MPPKKESFYAKQWDSYVESDWPEIKAGDEQLEWPGDEWGGPEGWEAIYEQLFPQAGVARWKRAVEIGPGSGKYTLKVLEASEVQVRAYDISPRFLDVCAERCQSHLRNGRLTLRTIDAARPDHMLADLGASGWRREVDAVYSIDAMVHVDLQYLVAYLLTASLVLRPGGRLVLTLADATTSLGFRKLLEDIRPFYPAQTDPSIVGKFEWVGPEVVRSVLLRMGFEIDVLHQHYRDMFMIAALRRPRLGEPLERYLTVDAELEDQGM